MSQDQKLLEVKKHSPPTPAPKPHINQKLQKAKKHPVHPPPAKKHSPPTPAPKPHVLQKLQKAKKQPVYPLLAKKPSPSTPAPKPQDHQKLQASNSVDAMQIPRRKTKHKGSLGQRGDRDSFVPSLLQKTSVTVTSAVKRLAVQKVSSTGQILSIIT